MATPILRDVHEHFPEVTITALAPHSIKELLSHNPHISQWIAFSRKKEIEKEETERVVEALEALECDTALLLTGSFSSAWQMRQAKIPRRIGFAKHFRSMLLTDAVEKESETQHLVTGYKRLLAPLGIPISQTAPELFITHEEEKAARDTLRKLGCTHESRIIGINPGAAYGSAKCWPRENFRALTEKLLKQAHKKTKIIFFGDPSSKELVDDICKDLPEDVINLATKTTLRELVAIMRQCDIILSNDSGPMHIAAALKKPLVAIFGSTNEVKTGPYGVATVIHKHVACAPCYLRKCPIDFRCMKRISVDEVFAALQ